MSSDSTPIIFTSSFLLDCVLLLEKTQSVKAVCDAKGCSYQAFNYHLNKLKRLEIVEKRGYGVWAVNRENFYLLDETKDVVARKNKKELKKIAPSRWGGAVSSIFSSDKVGGHAYIWVVKTPDFDWVRVSDRLKLRRDCKVIPQGLSFLVRGWRVWLCRRSIVLYAPKGERWVSGDEFLSYRSAFLDAVRVLREFELFLPFRLRDSAGRFVLKPRREHNAHLDEVVSRGVSCDGRDSFAVWDSQGVWLRVDSSLGVPELESEAGGSVERVESVRDASRLVREDFNTLKDEGVTRRFLLEQDARIQEKLEFYADHIKSHAEVMVRIGRLLERLENE